MDITVKDFKTVSPYNATVVLTDCVEDTVYADSHDIPHEYDDDIIYSISAKDGVVVIQIYHGDTRAWRDEHGYCDPWAEADRDYWKDSMEEAGYFEDEYFEEEA